LIHGFTKHEVAEVCSKLNQPSYRADQIWQWLYVHAVPDWAAMKNLPTPLRHALETRYSLASAVPLETQGNPNGTRKILARLQDAETIEEVLIPAGKADRRTSGDATARRRRTVCVSSQVGCRFHCAFCASGQAGFRRDLQVGEIVGQVLLAMRAFGDRPSHVVFMGIGEPFDNYDAVLKAVRIMNDKEGLNIAARRITISTCGVIPGIERLGEEGLQIELSVSLHAPDDALRSELMPVNRRYPLDALLSACKDYATRTKRLITFEYTLIDGVNDRPRQAAELAGLVADLPCRVNLIPLSPVSEFERRPSSYEAAKAFAAALSAARLNTTLRASKGGPLNAACGQLRISRSAIHGNTAS